MASPPMSPRIHNSDIDTLRNPKRFKRDYGESEEEKLAMCLVMLSHSTRDSTTEIATSGATMKESKQANSYKCNVCDKAFSCHQALGGHKASHRKKEATVTVLEVEENEALDYVPAHHSRGRIHKCSVCDKNFPTGQALGGHKRKHYEGVLGGKNSDAMHMGESSGVPSPTSSARKESSRTELELDLNMPALPEIELEL